MEEELSMQIEMTAEGMESTLRHLESELIKIRAGKASVHILDGIVIDYYGAPTPLNQVANINTPDPKMLVIQPWEKNLIDPIERAIMKANVGITPANDGELIRLNFPPLTEERRASLTKQVKAEGEQAKVAIRNQRRDANDEVKKMVKNGLEEDLGKKAEVDIQQITDRSIKKVDEIVEKKEKEIMTI